MVAFGALGLGVIAATKETPSYRHQLNAQRVQLTALGAQQGVQLRAVDHQLQADAQQITALTAGSTAGAVSSLQRAVSGLQHRVGPDGALLNQLKICLPQLSQEVSGLTVDNSDTGTIDMTDGSTDTFLQGAYITNRRSSALTAADSSTARPARVVDAG